MTAAIIWIIAGIILILSELLATSIVAVFIGIGALVTGLLLWVGLIESLAAQMLVFGLVSLGTLLLARKRLKAWFVGGSVAQGAGSMDFQKDIGARVTVEHDFNQGIGRVILNGVAWDAESDDPLKAGDVAWVVSHEGIHLTVSRNKPQ